MTSAQLLTLLLFGGGGAALLLAGLERNGVAASSDPEAYLRSLEWTEGETDEFELLLAEPFLRRVLRPLGSKFLALIANVWPSNYRDGIRGKLVQAGLASRYRAEEILTAQVLLGGAILAGGLAYTAVSPTSLQTALIVLVLLPFIGAAYPNVWVTRKVEERREAILKDLPDTIDLLAISVEAGVGFEGAIAVVCEHFTSPLSEELSRTLREMELGLPRRDALQNLKRRTEVQDLSNFVLALTQADALGMPIGRVLKSQADEMRLKRKQWAREKAAKLPVKILFPLMLFILPPVFVVVLGPAMSQIGQAF